ncbi:MFS transporter, DHA2 family, multidrug resistance protein [Streptomyces sp. Ag82_O1-12]|uniref:MFS transporter n=1 Tax=unclassified Streptomyces TaxID=2593676 RepID=UPI000BD446A8|nr:MULTISPECIES: MFS transporter [unclassified Streptomyces]SMQ19115.1 MFS transporter, DHA2 family, multidrug resistance protein [Streptomyces sp. Ag82_O1-12]SOD48156.1 MFS transporter, DHA2 family, multidrug resistance protein [Streptomyces sp. Ag82_G6-1]
MTTNPHPPALAGRREWTALGVLMLPLLLVSMDVSVLYFAIPAISADLEPSATQQLWIFDIYGFVLAGLLMTMGSLGDRIGRRRLLLIGAAAFGTASLVAAYATSAETLIAARAVLGIGGATLMPSTMALVRTMFTDPAQRTKAIGLWSGVMTAGIALGSVMSGVLVEHFWWGSVFLVNLPAMVLLLLLGPVLLPESRNPHPGRFDLLSVPLSMAAVLPVIYGLKELASEGWNVRYAMSVTVGLLFAALFVHRQRTAASPLISPQLFRGRGFSPAVVLNLVAAFGMMGSAYFTTQYIQSVLDNSPLEAALWSLLPSVPIGLAAPVGAHLVQRGVPRAYVVCGGFAVSSCGYVMLALVGTDSLWLLLAACAVLACGIVTVMSQVADLALSSAPVEKAGAASSLLETGTEFGGALSMAFLGSIGTAVYRHEIPETAPAAARETLGGALAVADRLPGRAGDALATAAREAFTSGMHTAAVTGAVLLAGAAAAAAVTLRRPRVRENAGQADQLSPSGV